MYTYRDLSGTVVAITGATAGIGRELARQLVEEGDARALLDELAGELASNASGGAGDGDDGSGQVTVGVHGSSWVLGDSWGSVDESDGRSGARDGQPHAHLSLIHISEPTRLRR